MSKKKGRRGEFLSIEYDRKRRRHSKFVVARDAGGVLYDRHLYRGKKSNPKGR